MQGSNGNQGLDKVLQLVYFGKKSIHGESDKEEIEGVDFFLNYITL
jgi:hypothetical protein